MWLHHAVMEGEGMTKEEKMKKVNPFSWWSSTVALYTLQVRGCTNTPKCNCFLSLLKKSLIFMFLFQFLFWENTANSIDLLPQPQLMYHRQLGILVTRMSWLWKGQRTHKRYLFKICFTIHFSHDAQTLHFATRWCHKSRKHEFVVYSTRKQKSTDMFVFFFFF